MDAPARVRWRKVSAHACINSVTIQAPTSDRGAAAAPPPRSVRGPRRAALRPAGRARRQATPEAMDREAAPARRVAGAPAPVSRGLARTRPPTRVRVGHARCAARATCRRSAHCRARLASAGSFRRRAASRTECDRPRLSEWWTSSSNRRARRTAGCRQTAAAARCSAISLAASSAGGANSVSTRRPCASATSARTTCGKCAARFGALRYATLSSR